MNLSNLVELYIPVDQVSKCQSVIFETWLNILSQDTPANIKSLYADNIFNFVDSKEHIELSIQWARKGYMFNPSAPDTNITTVTNGHKYKILRRAYASVHIAKELKDQLM